MRLGQRSSSSNILENIDEKLEAIKQKMSDRFKYNPKVDEIKEINT
jgi:hypothetical protein